MATVKVTITIPEEQLAAIRAAVARRGDGASVSGFLQHAAAVQLESAAAWRADIDEMLDATGGAPTPEERAWVDSVLHGVQE